MPCNGSTINFEFSFDGGYISRDHIAVTKIDADGVETPVSFTWAGDYTVTVSPALPAAYKLRIRRLTPNTDTLVNFSSGAAINEANLDKVVRQAVFAAGDAADTGSIAADKVRKDITAFRLWTPTAFANWAKDALLAVLPATFKGEKGDKGDPGTNSTVPGPMGPAPSLSIGTVTNVATGGVATAGLRPNGYGAYFLDLGLPIGATGSGAFVNWGAVGGSLLDQTDLVSALNGKASVGHNHDAAYVRLNGDVNSPNFIKFAHPNAHDGADGTIGAARFSGCLDIVGVQSVLGTGRKIKLWGEVIGDQHPHPSANETQYVTAGWVNAKGYLRPDTEWATTARARFVSFGPDLSGDPSLEVHNGGNSAGGAFMGFHRDGVYAAKLGLDANNYFCLTQWGSNLRLFSMAPVTGDTTFASESVHIGGNPVGFRAVPPSRTVTAQVNFDPPDNGKCVTLSGNNTGQAIGILKQAEWPIGNGNAVIVVRNKSSQDWAIWMHPEVTLRKHGELAGTVYPHATLSIKPNQIAVFTQWAADDWTVAGLD